MGSELNGRHKRASPPKNPRNPEQGAPTTSGEMIPIKPGWFTLPSSPSELPHLIGTRCRSCGEVYFPPRRNTSCPRCYEIDMEETPLSRTGKILSYTVVHQAPREWQGPVPYGMALIELPEKAVFYSSLTDCDLKKIKTGMPVELVLDIVRTEESGKKVIGYKFRPLE